MIDPKEAIRYYRIQLNRCKINLHSAKDRRDDRAANNIQRKMDIYEYTIEQLSHCKNSVEEVKK